MNVKRKRAGQRGSIMVQALVLLAGLVALMAVIAADQRTSLSATQNLLRQRRSEVAAKAAIARALAAVSAANTNLVTLNDDWAALGKNGDSRFDLGNGATFRVQIIDANALVNINTATQQQLQTLPLTTEQIDSLLDWRTAGTTPRTDGAKDEYYTTLSTPYNTKLARLTTLDELLLVKNWTANNLYYPSDGTNTAAASSGTLGTTGATAVTLQDANGNALPLIDVLTADNGMPNRTATGGNRTNLSGRLNPNTFEQLGANTNLATVLAQGGPYTTLRALLSRQGISPTLAGNLLNSASVSGAARLEGKLNLNTVTQSVLQTVPNITPDIASAIVAQQATGFSTMSQLATIAGMTTPRLAQVADSFGIGSDTFVVRAYGESGGQGVAYEAVIGVRNSLTRVLSFNRLAGTTVPFWWDWNADTTETVDAATLQSGTSTTASAPSAAATTGGGR